MNQPAAPPGPQPSASVWEDFVDILYTPAVVFARRESGKAWIPLLVVTLALGSLFLVNSRLLEPMFDAEFDRSMAAAVRDNPQMTPEVMAQARRMGRVFATVGAFVFVPIIVCLIGFALWLFGKVAEARITFGTAVLVAAYAYVPRVIEALLSGVQGLILDPATLDGRYRLTLGLGRFLDPDTTAPMLLAIAGRVDVFTIWVTVLLAVGLSVTGKVSRQSAAVVATFVWVAGALPALFQAMRS
ncbi:MAG TPA: YIP1 family protein [Gemmatimonadales bacterium]|nr:YIP1 family protein [Gemmatimonadales bacterium]